ncbi:MAG TPA: class I SAM-dependent methyltransferase [Acidimicrobiia bacterium]
MSWDDLSDWWLSEIADDTAYGEVVTPLLIQVLRPVASHRYLDLGCGEGRVMRTLAGMGVTAWGVDVSERLAALAGMAVVAELPEIPIRDGAFDGVCSVLTLEHLSDHEAFFADAARVTKSGGVLAIVINHPVWTAPDSTPITDSDGEVLWRPGDYFAVGATVLPVGETTVTFHHRSLSTLLNAAAAAGWSLQHMVEQPHHEYEDQTGIPRLLACRWRLLE